MSDIAPPPPRDEPTGRGSPMRRKIAAIVAADVAGYSRLVAEDEEETIARLGSYREVYDDFVSQYGGRIFNTAGDAVLSEFESAVEAVRAAIDIQDALRTRDLPFPPNRKLQFRIGISIGDVIERNGDLLGDGVNIAARLESLAEPGGICVSRSVHEAVANKISVPFRYLGEKQVKNIPHPVAAFEVDFAGGDAIRLEPAPTGLAPARRKGLPVWAIAGAAVAFVLIVADGGYWAWRFGTGSGPDRHGAAPPTQTAPQQASTGAPSVRQLYHDAVQAESEGRTADARQAYETIEGRGTELIDPALRYAALLRLQDGRAAAREKFADLAREKPSRTVLLVHALQFDGDEQQKRVAAFAATHPAFAPAQYWLGEQFSDDRLGRQPTLTERAAARAAYARFIKADQDGTLTPFFVDLSMLSSWVDRANARLKELDAIAAVGAKPTAQFTRSNDGWIATIQLPEAALALDYRIGEQGAFQPTGDSPAMDPRTGKPFPNVNITLPPDQAATAIDIRYTDAAGHVTDPIAIPFEPAAALYAGQRRALELTANSWLAFRRDMPSLLYFTQLVVYRCAIKQVTIGFDGAAPDTPVPLPPCDERHPYEVPTNPLPYLTISPSIHAVAVQLTYADGTRSGIKTIRR